MDFSLRMTSDEAGRYLAHSTYWLLTNRKRLDIPAFLIGGKYYFLKEELDVWIDHQRTGHSTALAKGSKAIKDSPELKIRLAG